MRTIWVSKPLPDKEYVGGTITDGYGQDISGAAFVMALGSDNVEPPDTGWVSPSVAAQGATTSSRVLKLLVDSSTPLGTYFVWGDIADNPEQKAILLDGPFVVA
jgi:hypothetical protein